MSIRYRADKSVSIPSLQKLLPSTHWLFFTGDTWLMEVHWLTHSDLFHWTRSYLAKSWHRKISLILWTALKRLIQFMLTLQWLSDPHHLIYLTKNGSSTGTSQAIDSIYTGPNERSNDNWLPSKTVCLQRSRHLLRHELVNSNTGMVIIEPQLSYD